MSSKSKRLRSVEGLTHRAERRQSHPPDTESRLLTEMNRRFRAQQGIIQGSDSLSRLLFSSLMMGPVEY